MCIREQSYSSTTILSESYQGYLRRHLMVIWTLFRMLSATGDHSQLKYSHYPRSSLILIFGHVFVVFWHGVLVSIMWCFSASTRWFAGSQELDTVKIEANFILQVRIRCVEKCPNLLLKAFKEAISENFEKKGNKFKYDLNETQVCISCIVYDATFILKCRSLQKFSSNYYNIVHVMYVDNLALWSSTSGVELKPKHSHTSH